MPRTPSGEYNLPPGQPVITDTIIESDVHNTFADDVAEALTDSLSRSGKGGMLVPFRVIDGSPENPGLSFVNDYRCGMSRNFISGDLQLSAHGQLSFIVRNTGTETVGIHITETLSAVSQAEAIPDAKTVAITTGLHTDENVKIGKNDIQAANNSSPADLHINKHGGDVYINGQLVVGNSFAKSEHVDESVGTPDAGKPIILNAQGKVDLTMCDCDALVFVSGWTPTTGDEYPDTTGYEFGAFWLVELLSGNYTFTGGDLSGRTCENGSAMIYGEGRWGLTEPTVDVTPYYRIDGATAITAPFAGGGQQLKNVADGTDDNDAATVRQVRTLDFLPIDGKAADSNLLDGRDSTYFSLASHNHDGVYSFSDHNHDSDYSDINHNHDADYFKKVEFLDASTGIPDAGKPIVLDFEGHIDPSMLDISVFHYVGELTPTPQVEYPDVTNESKGAFWIIQGLTSDYTFSTGDLDGRTVSNGDFIAWADPGWSIIVGKVDPTLYYRLDGTNALTADFQAGGFQLKALADGVLSTDAATVGQVNSGFLPIDGKAADSDMLDSHDSLYFSKQANVDAVSDCNDQKKNGWYFTDDSTANAPFGETWGSLIVFGNDATLLCQLFTGSSGVSMNFRSFENGVWSEWNRVVDNIGTQEFSGRIELKHPSDENYISGYRSSDDTRKSYFGSPNTDETVGLWLEDITGTLVNSFVVNPDYAKLSGQFHVTDGIQMFNDEPNSISIKDNAGVKRGVVGCTGAAGDNSIILRSYNNDGSGAPVGQLTISGADGVASFDRSVRSAVSPVEPDDLTRKDYVDTTTMAHVPRQVGDANLMTTSGTYGVSGSTANLPIASYGTLLAQYNGDIGTQIYTDYAANVTYIRTWYNTAAAFTSWKEIAGGGVKVVASATFNPSGGLNRSYNVSGVTDHGEGNWTVNFASGISSSYPMCSATPQHPDERFGNIRARSSTSVAVGCWNAADNSSLRDPDFMDLIVTDF